MSTRWSSQIVSYSVRGLAMACGPVGDGWIAPCLVREPYQRKGMAPVKDGRVGGALSAGRSVSALPRRRLRERLGIERLGALGVTPDAADAERRETVRVVGLGEREDRARVAGGGGAAEEEPGA